MDFLARRHWIFDMDGTLTFAAHDFDAFKVENGMPVDRPILEVLDEWPAARAAAVHTNLRLWEEGIARKSQAADDAVVLLNALAKKGHQLGVLTRNTRENALLTLKAAGLMAFFEPSVILGRDSAAPKPSPAGVLHILDVWGAHGSDAVMVGDYLFDIEAGRQAGTATVLIDREAASPPYGHIADRVVTALSDLLRR
ncbi:MAG: HAD-IA family hydrolase [Myxococcota bacterium]